MNNISVADIFAVNLRNTLAKCAGDRVAGGASRDFGNNIIYGCF